MKKKSLRISLENMMKNGHVDIQTRTDTRYHGYRKHTAPHVSHPPV